MSIEKINKLKEELEKEIEKLNENIKEKSAVSYRVDSIPFEIGKAYFVRTVTYHLTGRVKEIVGDFLILEDAAWIADSGRFADAIQKGKLDEVEPVEDIILNISSITDAFEWKHKLPRDQK